MTTDIYSHSFFAMGCHMCVWLQSNEIDLLAVENYFHTAEAQLTRFRPESELSRLNNTPEQWVTVSDLLWRVLVRALDLAAESEGLFDPTLLSDLEQVGYRDSFEQIGRTARFFQKRHRLADPPRFRFRAIQLDEARQAVWLPRGIKIDLGGIAKGFVAQEVVDWLSGYGSCLLDAGGDLVAGFAPVGQLGWPVGISAPYEGSDDRPNLVRMWLSHGCLATSGVDYRQWLTADGRKHHIIDPRTGTSAETDLLTVSVMMVDACEAEAWATTSLILGQEEAYLRMNQHGVEGLLINQMREAQVTPQMRPHLQWEAHALETVVPL